MMGPAARNALRALNDVGLVRAPWDHPGYRALRVHRFVTFRPAGDQWDYQLTPRGKQYAERMFR